jgi:toxin ParE1/3/4
MNRYVLSPRAQADISEIWDYTAKRWGSAQAESYLRQLRSSIGAVAADPGLGSNSEHIRAGYRRYRVGSHVLFYRVTAAGIDVIRILHRRMDFSRHL